jgi:hypothetical protein
MNTTADSARFVTQVRRHDGTVSENVSNPMCHESAEAWADQAVRTGLGRVTAFVITEAEHDAMLANFAAGDAS